jgi:hypothetical protein
MISTNFREAFTPIWTKVFTKRQIKEINFSMVYADDFSHGTDGHNAKIIIAKMAIMLNDIEQGKTIEQIVSENSEN